MMKGLMRTVSQIRNGRRFGVTFLRNKWFAMPSSITICGGWHKLAYPQEVGVRNDFLTSFVRDEYGLTSVPGGAATIVDIGANVGFFSMAARNYFPKATIHAYEPNPRVAQYLLENMDGLRVEVFGEAVGLQDGFVNINDGGDSNQATTETVESGSIRQSAFATVVERAGEIDLLKLDCEGAEWDLFEDKKSWKAVRILRMEYHLFRGQTFADVEKALSGLGFGIEFHGPSSNFGTVWARRS